MNATQEEWRAVVGFEDAYEISDHGRLRSLDRTITRGDGVRTRLKGRLLKPYLCREDNYYRSSLTGQVPVRIHVLVLEAFVGPRPDGLVACHNDGNGSNNHVANLRWDTYSENNTDLVRHHTHWQTVKTHCPQGHPYDEMNTYHQKPSGGRKCRICQREANRRCKAKKARDLIRDRAV